MRSRASFALAGQPRLNRQADFGLVASRPDRVSHFEGRPHRHGVHVVALADRSKDAAEVDPVIAGVPRVEILQPLVVSVAGQRVRRQADVAAFSVGSDLVFALREDDLPSLGLL